MTHDKINAAKNVPGSTAYQKNILQNFHQFSKNKEYGSRNRISRTEEESKEWQKNNDVIDNNENKDTNKNRNKAFHSSGSSGDSSSISVAEKRRRDLGYALSYCVAFSPDLKKCKCNVHENHITVRTAYNYSMYEYLQDKMTLYTDSLKVMTNKLFSNKLHLSQSRGDSNLNSELGKREYREFPRCTTHAAVTLITVGWAEDYNAGTMDRILESWCGPKVKSWKLCFLIYFFVLFYTVLYCFILYNFIFIYFSFYFSHSLCFLILIILSTNSSLSDNSTSSD